MMKGSTSNKLSEPSSTTSSATSSATPLDGSQTPLDFEVLLPKLGHLATDNNYDSPDSSEYDIKPSEKVNVIVEKKEGGKIKTRHQFQDVSI